MVILRFACNGPDKVHLYLFAPEGSVKTGISA